MPPVAVVPPSLADDPFLGSAAVARGMLTPRQLRGARWRRLFDGVYVHRDVPVTHELRARAAAIRVPASVVTGHSAAALWGVEAVAAEDDVEVTLPPGSHMVRVRGIRTRRALLDDADIRRRRGVRVTSPEATAVRLSATLALDDAVVAVDQLIATGVVHLRGVRRRAAKARGPGSALARRVCGLADGRAESPQETRLRLLIGPSGLPMPLAQFTGRASISCAPPAGRWSS